MILFLLNYFNFNSRKRDFSIDLLRSIAIYGVLLIHSLNYLVNIKSNYYEPYFELSGAWRFCVPFFLIIAGMYSYTLKNISFVSFLKKMLKLVIPFFFASIFSYYIFWGEFSFRVFFNVLLNGRADYAQWFIPFILQFYFIYYFSEKIFKKYNYLFWIFLSSISILSIIFEPIMVTRVLNFLASRNTYFAPYFYYIDETFISYTKELAQIHFYFIYFGAGIFIPHFLKIFKNKNHLIIFSFFLAILSGFLFYKDFISNTFFQIFSYFNFYLIFYSIFLFIFLYQVFSKINFPNFLKTFTLIGKHSLWILLFHGFFIKFFTHIFYPNGVSSFYRFNSILLSLFIAFFFMLIFFLLEKFYEKKSS